MIWIDHSHGVVHQHLCAKKVPVAHLSEKTRLCSQCCRSVSMLFIGPRAQLAFPCTLQFAPLPLRGGLVHVLFDSLVVTRSCRRRLCVRGLFCWFRAQLNTVSLLVASENCFNGFGWWTRECVANPVAHDHRPWLGKRESLMFRLRGLHSVLANLHLVMVIARHNQLRRLRCAPALCLSLVAIAQPCHVCSNVGSLAHRRLRMLPPVSCQKRPPVSPPSPVPGSFFLVRRWSEFAIMPHIVAHSDLSAFQGKSVRKTLSFGPTLVPFIKKPWQRVCFVFFFFLILSPKLAGLTTCFGCVSGADEDRMALVR